MDDGVASNSSIVWFIVLLLLEMLFYSFDSAFQYRKEEERGEEEKDESGRIDTKQARIVYLLRHLPQYTSAVQLGIVTVNILFGALYLYRLNSYFGYVVYRMAVDKIDHLYLWHIKMFAIGTAVFVTFVLLYIIVTFGISIPKKVTSRNPEKWFRFFVTPIYFYVRLTSPLTALISATAGTILRLFGIKGAGRQADVTEEKILSMVSVGHEQGILEANEAEMISNIFEFGDKEAKDVMINRNNMVGIESTMTLQEAAAFIVDAHNSRFPVYDGTIDHIIGILHLKDVMRMQMNNRMKNRPIGKIKGLLREPRFITEKRKIDDLFRVMRAEKIQMVIVVDEYGQTAGLVALEDILEEIVGNIEDEYDEEASYIVKNDTDGYVIQGKMPLEELEEQLQISFEEEPFDTVNGFVISRLEHIPEEGEDFEFEYEGYLFRILEVKDRMIQSVLAMPHGTKEQDKEEREG
ncbi:MAG: hemolysin family protein [Lachnospiraceae bacterium]